MNRFQTLRIVLLMLLLAAASVAAYLFFRHELYFCLLFSLLIVLGIILYVCQWQQKTTLMVARMIEGIRYSDFSLSIWDILRSGEKQYRSLPMRNGQSCAPQA